ncbi:serine hydrolase domain-containing protein [Nannocystis punicea]|uniref:Serine hydrolase n=1 Tax=Nannocystis punicea TaxID=2995304 RepID=A0ABY7HFN5_9BACT|nr:serine hydrolase domain-containing protein [Nannocystis poenicansa]WAS98112.1 serine hydrolase [Nannocystis poenicansa]
MAAAVISRRSVLGLVTLAACRADPRDPECRRASGYVGAPRRDALPLDGRQAGAIGGVLAPDFVARLETRLDEVLARSQAPAISAAYAVPGSGMWTATRGLACVEPATPVGEGARFQACSVGKLITAALIWRLVERGQLGIEDPISKWFPRYPGAANITIDQLLSHTSGIYSFNSDPNFERELRAYHSPEALIEEAAGHANLFCPGATWSYSNTGYVMLGRIVERCHDRSLAEVIAAEVAQPLELHGLVGQEPGVAVAGLVRGHRARVPVPADTRYEVPHGAGSVATGADDLVRVLHAVLAARLVAATSLQAMLRDMAPMFEDPSQRYGRGLMMVEVPGGPGLMIGHSGGAPGFRAVVAYLPAEPAFVAVMINDELPAEAGLWALVQAARAA